MKIIFFLLFLAGTIPVAAQNNNSTGETRKNQVENSLSPDMIFGDTLEKLNIAQQMLAHHTKGVSIAVIKDYKIDWASGYGWADEGEKRAVTTDTRFQAASISKSLNSLAILKLVEQGKLDLESDINNYLKSWKFPYDSFSRNRKINIANLLSHSAGLGVHGFGGYTPGDSIPTLLQILNGEKPANSPAIRSEFEPSKKFQYSGGGTSISQLILTDVTGRRYEEFLKKEVLDPIGMTHSSYSQPPVDVKELATAYYADGNPIKGKFHIYPEQAAAGLWTTPTDLARYIIETQLEYEGKSKKVLSQKMMQRRLTGYIDSGVGLGVFIQKKENERYFNHNGGNEGFLCTYYGSFHGGNGLVIMINNDDFGIIPEIVNSVALVYGWKDFYKPVFKKVITLSPEKMKNYLGNFLLVTDTLSIRFCGDQLCIFQNNQPAAGFKMVFTADTLFSIKDLQNIDVSIELGDDGRAASLEVKDHGMSTKAKRIN